MGRTNENPLRLIASPRRGAQPRAAKTNPWRGTHRLRIHAGPDRVADADTSAGFCHQGHLVRGARAGMGHRVRLIGLAGEILSEVGTWLRAFRQRDRAADTFETALENLAAARTAVSDLAFAAHAGDLTPAHVLATASAKARIKAARGAGRSRGTVQNHQIFVKTPWSVDDC